MYFLRRRGLLAGAVGLLAGGFAGSPAQAQKAFCPTSFPGQAGISFDINECTNGNTGAYSNTALASQSLSDLSQSSTQDATKATMASISDRRANEEERCPDGLTRVAGTCRPGTASRFAPEPGGTWMSVPAPLLAFAPPQQAFAKVPVVEQGPRMGAWMQGYGDYERRTGRGAGIGEFSVLALDVRSTTWSGGVLGGVDITFRNVAFGGDGLITGLLAGYMSSHVTVNTSNTSSDPATTPSGFSTLKARLSGPVTGVYASYFNGGFSTDLAFKVEFLDLNVSFNDILGFGPNPDLGIAAATVPFSGSGSTRLNNYTTSGNVNYRVPAGRNFWIEPTAGFQYTRSDYGSDAALLGLADGSLLRLQAGARFGVESSWDAVRMTTVLTGLVYDNVVVSGGAIQNGGNPLVLSDEGKLRAQGILALNFYHGSRVSSFLQADVQGGDGFFGAGGKTGLRVVW
jgi:hypothetical protein